MWLVQLHKAKEDAPIGWVYGTTDWNDDYIYSDGYLPYALNLYNNWNYDYTTKKRILILKKKPEGTTLIPLQNERFARYDLQITYNFLLSYKQIIYFEYLKDEDFFIDLYITSWFPVLFYIQDETASEILSSPNPVISFLQYIKGKTLNIGIIGNETPKYSIVFDDNCKYYYGGNGDYITFYVIKNPFLFFIYLVHDDSPMSVVIVIYAKPRLIEDFNNYSTNESTYEPDNDQSLRLNNIINSYFDTTNKTGLLYENVNINDDTENFRYNLIRALLVDFRSEIVNNYYFSLDGNTGTLYPPGSNYMPLDETPVCIYFPLLRPKLDNNGFNMTWPQYDPNDTSKYMYNLYLSISLNNNGEVEDFSLTMNYGNSLSHQNYCFTNSSGYMSSWRFGTCDLTLPFRFVGATDCTATDYWDNDTIRNNANYLFLIVKPSSSDTGTYNIKGVGCDELTSDISSFSDFSADYKFINSIGAAGINEIQRITFSESGWPIEVISNTLDSYRIDSSETCFVLFNESLAEDMGDFTSIYQAVSSTLPNSIVCYIGSDEKIPDTYRNKVLHSDAIVTDLDTNEQMPLVIKYIRYAKRIHGLFNG
jgi:hypothetical protein